MLQRFKTLLIVALVAIAPFAAFAAHDHGGDTFFDRIDAALAAGDLNAEEALLHKFAYVFDHDALPEAWRPAEFAPVKCATEMIRDFENLRPRLSSTAVKRLDGYLTPELSGEKATYLSPLGHFNFTYFTTGGNAVPSADTNPANGIPDFVERCAEYMDTSWETEIVTMGFTAPPSHPYAVSFESMGAYGYTTVIAGTATRIVLHNTFVGFPPNDDPDGDVLGAAKVTAAHEFKHASQRAQSNWSEGGWVELDATWMEDVVFDQVNDFYNYLPSGSGISAPETSLDDGGSGSYEDCIFQTWMSETWTNQIIIDFWNWRTTHQSQSVLLSYDAVLGSYGSSLADGYPVFAAWNMMTQSRHITGEGYEEGQWFTPSVVNPVNSYPNVQTGATAHLAAKNFFCYNFSGLTGTFDIDFDGENGRELHLMAITKKLDGTGIVEEIALDANNDVQTSLGTALQDISWIGLVVVNSQYSGGTASWSLTTDTNEIVPLPAASLDMSLIDLTLTADDDSSTTVTLSNTGDPGSTLNWSVAAMDLDPTALLRDRPFSTRPRGNIERIAPDGLVRPDASVLTTSRYAGDCVYGNDDTGNIQGYYGSWWAGNETYAYQIDPTAAGCSCALGFNVKAVHMMIYMETASSPQVQAHLAADAGGCNGPGAIIDSSAPITVTGSLGNGYYDVEIPCDFVCTDVAAGPYYILFEFLDANGPVGIVVDTTPTSCVNFNEWDASGFQELVGGYGFAGDMLIWADVDCCGTATPEVTVAAPNGGEFLQRGMATSLTWTATVLTDVKVELSRDNGGSWETLFASTPNDGSEVWTVAGASSSQCLLRVSSPDDMYSDVSDAAFTIFGPPSWLFVGPPSGALAQGSSTGLIVGVVPTGLAVGNYTGWVVVDSDDPLSPDVITVQLEVTPTGTAVGDTPMAFGLEGNYPNPFNPSTKVRFTLARAGMATVDVIDLQGRLVKRLYTGELQAGPTDLTWDGTDAEGRPVASGTYLAKLSSGGLTATHKMLLAK